MNNTLWFAIVMRLLSGPKWEVYRVMACGEKVGEEPRLFLYGFSGEEGGGESTYPVSWLPGR